LIDLKAELGNYPFIDLKSIEESGTILTDNMKNSIILYNKALDSLRMNSEDIAIIELKKAIAMNPNFHEAMNLLGICYSYVKDYTKASEVFNKVVAAENNCINAMRYLSELNGENEGAKADIRKRSSQKAGSARVEGKRKDSMLPDGFKKGRNVSFLKYAACFLAGAAVVVVICLPFMGKKDGNSSKGDDISPKPAIQADVELQSKYEKLNDDFQKQKSQLEASNSQVDYYKNVVKLFDVEKQLLQKDYEAASDSLLILKAIDLKGSEKERFDSLYQDAVPKAVKAIYIDAMNLYNGRKYQDAIKRFLKMQAYGSEWPNLDAGMYYLGRSYAVLDDTRNALEIYQKLKAAYPNSRFAAMADWRIKELTGAP